MKTRITEMSVWRETGRISVVHEYTNEAEIINKSDSGVKEEKIEQL